MDKSYKIITNFNIFLNEELNIGDDTNIGIISDETIQQFKINGKWYHKSIVKPKIKEDKIIDTNNKINSIISILIEERGKGYITLYHGTDNRTYNKIISSGIFNERGIGFLTTSKKEAMDYSKNKSKYRGIEHGAVLELYIPKWSVKRNVATGEYETEFTFEMDDNGIWFPTNDSILNYNQ